MRGVALVAMLGLTACGGGFGGGTSTSTAASNPLNSLFGTRPASEVTVTQNRVRIAGPEGFCVDPTGTEDLGSTAVVLLGNCANIPGSLRGKQPDVSAALMASVGDNPGEPFALRLAEMDSYFRSEAGRQVLSASGNAATVDVLDSFAQEDVLYMRVRDSGPLANPDRAPEHWRAIFDVKGSVATLSVMGLRDNPLPPQDGLRTLQAFTANVLSLNGAAAPPPVAAPREAEPEPRSEPAAAQTRPPVIGGALFNYGIFRRLFG